MVTAKIAVNSVHCEDAFKIFNKGVICSRRKNTRQTQHSPFISSLASSPSLVSDSDELEVMDRLRFFPLRYCSGMRMVREGRADMRCAFKIDNYC